MNYALAALALVLAFLLWKTWYTRRVRKEAIQRSLAVTAGKVYEQLVGSWGPRWISSCSPA